ncbi:ABC transporter permease [Draconibacterium sp.]|nr:ABC transporter permease [Draconibacterium sp.]
MKRLLKFEVIKLMHRPRTFLSIGFMAILVLLIFWGIKSEGVKTLDYLLKAFGKNFFINGNILNGYLVIYFILNTLWIHVPILIVIVTGDLFSSELEEGTIRLVVSRPLQRYKLVMTKHITAVFFVLLFMLFWALFAIWPGFLLFGKGDLVVIFNGVQILEEKELLWRFIPAFIYAFLGMSSFAIFSVAVSFFARRSLITILISLGVLVVSTLLQTLGASLFKGWESFLITYHLSQWQLFFYTDLAWNTILNSVICLLGFSFVCIIASLVRFNYLKITE